MNGKEVLYLRSFKERNEAVKDVSSSCSNDEEEEENDIWDDTILIEAYDKAIQQAQNQLMKKIQSSTDQGDEKKPFKTQKNTQWKVGDKCRSEYSIDSNYYEADITDIIEGTGICIVKYVGYENEEEVPLSKLKPSAGDMARHLQLRDAKAEQVDVSPSLNTEPEIILHDPRKKGRKQIGKGKKIGSCASSSGIFPNSAHLAYQPGLNMSIPPPPPPHLFNNPGINVHESEAMSAMLMSWYMSGYHTGYYQGLKAARKNTSSSFVKHSRTDEL